MPKDKQLVNSRASLALNHKALWLPGAEGPCSSNGNLCVPWGHLSQPLPIPGRLTLEAPGQIWSLQHHWVGGETSKSPFPATHTLAEGLEGAHSQGDRVCSTAPITAGWLCAGPRLGVWTLGLHTRSALVFGKTLGQSSALPTLGCPGCEVRDLRGSSKSGHSIFQKAKRLREQCKFGVMC